MSSAVIAAAQRITSKRNLSIQESELVSSNQRRRAQSSGRSRSIHRLVSGANTTKGVPGRANAQMLNTTNATTKHDTETTGPQDGSVAVPQGSQGCTMTL